MARQIVLDTSVLRLWAVRSLLLGLGDREPAIISPRWSTAALADLEAGLVSDFTARHGPEGADRDAARVVRSITAAYPEAEVTGVPDNLELDLLDRRDADVAGAAVVAGALVVTTTSPGRFPAAHVGHLGLTALHPDDLLLELHANDPWKVLHATVVFAHNLRGETRPLGFGIDALAHDAPKFADVVREILGGLVGNQPPTVFAATHGQVAPVGGGTGNVVHRVRSRPLPRRRLTHPVAGHGGRLPRECAFVGVTRTARHWTLVWTKPDEPTLREAWEQMRAEHLNPRIS